MEMVNLSLPATNRFASNYLRQSAEVMSFFHYHFNDSNEDKARLEELKNRSFPRMQVADHIESFMEPFPASEAIKASLAKLRQPDSVVVIGGQQAGILTGPLYSIHKVISIIKLAGQKEKQLGVPVVPVFWIAGEDHDFHEVNHVFVPVDGKMDKWAYPKKVVQKKMVSDIRLDTVACITWVENLLENFGETEHTNDLLEFARKQVNKSTTFVDFFAHIIMELFKDHGLLVVDSGNQRFRLLQKEFFAAQIVNHEAITFSLHEQQKEIEHNGFPITIEGSEQAANLFYYDQKHNERILLEFDQKTDQFVGKSGRVAFLKQELLEISAANPEKLSNNVVTRPLMQEWLFPTLAFIAGPGEIAYWAELKLVFEHFHMKMPPIVPRLNITFLDRSVETDLTELGLNLADVLQRGTEQEKKQFLDSIRDKEFEALFHQVKELLMAQYRTIEAKTDGLDKGLVPLVKKNEKNILKEIDFMQTKFQESIRQKHDVVLNKYARVDLSLRPVGSPQERVWNVFYYLNQCGLNFINDIMTLNFEFDGRHKVIKL
ncbi:bacillithiol biosynthesis cysteine-adding enzyme BshC [Bacillus sp. FJAT-29814]|uniref:bacillithiol biosynthesis cysteine-adding enzyme BshC n=1 Tax=Bacillus sp. FJAT-29814 TaxID=1729688 RepID=UPI00082C088D|nr:bacillithiol biosynthesis cysteine-adding enzyme BshC [Bacillus sp. FJAT-29814]